MGTLASFTNTGLSQKWTAPKICSVKGKNIPVPSKKEKERKKEKAAWLIQFETLDWQS